MAPQDRQRQTTQPLSGAANENILVVKLGAFGNIVLSLSAFAAIRHHHRGAHIAVLTSAAYADWLRGFPYFDSVLVDPRPAWWDLAALARLRRMLTNGRFRRIYDLQTSTRSSRYFRLFPPKHRPDWSGIAYGCSTPDRNPQRNRMHDMDRQEAQLRQAGITVFPPVDLSWCRGDIGRFGLEPAGREADRRRLTPSWPGLPQPPTSCLNAAATVMDGRAGPGDDTGGRAGSLPRALGTTRDFALLVPGSSPHRPAKRWPVEHFAAVARELADSGIRPVCLGAAQESALAASIPAALDLCGQTSFGDLAELARAARFAVGNDTGPMHLIAAAGCPTVTLFSDDSDPSLCAPRGRWTRVLRRAALADLPVEDVLACLPDRVTA